MDERTTLTDDELTGGTFSTRAEVADADEDDPDMDADDSDGACDSRVERCARREGCVCGQGGFRSVASFSGCGDRYGCKK